MNRLQTIASLVDENAVLYDIGTDHAYLFLEVFNKISRGFACDIAEKPLQTAINTIDFNNLYTKVSPLLSNGLEKVDFEIATNISICGMGAELIIDILSQNSQSKTENITYIFQPMTRTELLRKYLYENGFEITDEIICKEDRRFYTIIKCNYTGFIQKVDIFDCYLSPQMKTDALYNSYIQYEIEKCEQICSQINDLSNERYQKYEKIKQKLTESL